MSAKSTFLDRLIRYKDPVAQAAFAPQLKAGESVSSWAHGLKQPPMPVMFLLGPIANNFLTKEYLIGLTNQRVVLLRVKGKKAEVLEVTEYELDKPHTVTIEALKSFDRVVIEDENRPFEATFNPVTAPDNLENARAIVAALKATTRAAA